MTDVQWLTSLFGTLSFMASGLSAHLWYRASKIALPPSSSDSWEGTGPFSDALRKISEKNATAAFIAALAALSQAGSMAMPIFGPMFGLR